MPSLARRDLHPGRLAAFRERFDGTIVLPTDPDYDAARAVWNGMIDRRPAIIVRPAGATAVLEALRFGRDEDLPVAVRSGGHSLPGHSTCDGGIVIDLGRLRGVSVDPARRIARANGGALLGELDDAAQAYGLACNSGTVSHTGVAGLTLGGGMGRLQRKLGLTVDALRAVELVTADGRQVRASAEEHSDLFWGVRGAGANFGIVTAFEFEVWPIGPTITRGVLTYPGERAREVVAAFTGTMAEAPDELMASLIMGRAPAEPELPAAIHGQPVVMLSIAYCGAIRDDDLAGLTALGPPIDGALETQRYLESQHANDATLAWGHRVYAKSAFLASMPDALVDALDLARRGGTGRGCHLHLGTGWRPGARPGGWHRLSGPLGAVLDRGRDAVGRPRAGWRPHRLVTAGDRTDGALPRGGSYVNDASEHGDDAQVRAIYGDARYERLVQVKRAWDPDNVFHLNQNIRP